MKKYFRLLLKQTSTAPALKRLAASLSLLALLLGLCAPSWAEPLPAFFYNNPVTIERVKQWVEEEKAPDEELLLSEYLEIPINRAPHYGSFIRGLLVAPETGTYYFYVSADNDGQFYLSSDSSPENLSSEPLCLVAGHNCTANRVYDKYPTQKSVPIELSAGKSYYFEGYHCDYGYDSNFSVAWATPSMGDTLPSLPISIEHASVYNEPASPPQILIQPEAQKNLWEGDELHLSVLAQGTAPLTYQWYKDGEEIAGAVGMLYRLQKLSLMDAGSYTVEIRNELGSVMSEAALVEIRPTGNLLQARFYDKLTSLAQLKSRIAEGDSPDERCLLEEHLEIPLNRAVNFGTFISGLILPPETGTYYFYVSADNDGQFYLSSDSSPENLSSEPLCLVAGHNCTASRVYDKYPAQKSAPVELSAGNAYYFEAYHCDYGYDSNFSVAWATPSMGDTLPSLPIEALFLQPAGAVAPSLAYSWSGGLLELTFTGTLQSYDAEQRLWVDLPTQGGTYELAPEGKERFFRTRN
ncbi:MAG: PA14 domain-containing protein [Limisphaerales bacterium]|jgi:hypothetical protein|nr:immunoglobulin domain-containing protein [Verrucomicrobiota bacterium]